MARGWWRTGPAGYKVRDGHRGRAPLGPAALVMNRTQMAEASRVCEQGFYKARMESVVRVREAS